MTNSIPVPPGDLVETMRFDPVEGLCLLERHLARLSEAAAALGFAFDRHDARNALQAATFRLDAPACVRLLVARSGALSIASAPLPPPPTAPVTVRIVARPDAAARSGARTTAPRAEDAARTAAGTFEILFATPRGYLTEGSFTTLFVPGRERLRTPALMNGVLRAELIATARAEEAVLRAADLAGGFFVGNALLGLVPATLA